MKRSRWKAFGAVLPLAMLAASACGSDESGGSSSKCSQGATRACLGPGACNGAQSCAADGTWSACDCGGSGGSAGAGGTGAAAGDSGVGGAVGGAGGASGSGGGGVDGAAGTSGCPSGKGPAMVNVGTFCVDTTEVTQAQYAQFVAAKGSDVSGQVKECSWNASYKPAGYAAGSTDALATQCGPTRYDPANKPNHPVPCVDWCDAQAFCAWAGKRLCGAVGGGSAYADPGSLLKAELPFACSNGGKTFHPYGDVFKQDACFTYSDFGVPQNVKGAAECHGLNAPFDVVFDLVGNVAEWSDACDVTPSTGGEFDFCPVNGSYVGGTNTKCGGLHSFYRQDVRGFVGFRCCAEPS